MKERFETFTVLINRIRRNMRKIKIREMSEYGLRSPHLSCIYYLYTSNGLTATELCERCEEDKSTVSRALEYLEANGFIVCKSHRAKRYNSLLKLTDKGREVGKQVYERAEGILAKIGKDLTEEERIAFYRTLSIISGNLQAIADDETLLPKRASKHADTKAKHIPIFFSTDDNYIPYLDVAISSLIENASKSYSYRIVVLNTGLSDENIARVKQNERPGFDIDFVDISEDVKEIKARFKNVYHFSIVTYYRMFIASLFPEYDKVVYLDCDLIVKGDVAELYNTELGENILGACPEEYVQNTPEFRLYAEKALGVDPDTYVNAGVLVMNLHKYRKNKIEKKFIKLLTKYDFDLLDPDQAYLNYLCRGKILVLPNGWNKEPFDIPCEGPKNIVHYALYKKPWQYSDVTDGEYFWEYAERSPFYSIICQRRDSFGDEERAKKEAAGAEILKHAIRIVNSDETFANRL